MQPEHLHHLLLQHEGPNIEFKRAFYKLEAKDGEAKKRQRDELIKDILALANGSTSGAGEPAYLIIGADDQVGPSGRATYDIADPVPPAETLQNMVSAACDPPLDDLRCDRVPYDGNHIIVLTIPPSPHVYETTRKLTTPSQTFSEHVVFMRQGAQIRIASAKERSALLDLKRLRFYEQRNAPPRTFGALVSGLSIGTVGIALGEKLTESKRGKVMGGVIGTGVGLIFGSAIGQLYSIVMQLKAEWHRLSRTARVVLVTVAGAYIATAWNVAGRMSGVTLPHILRWLKIGDPER